MASLFDLNLTSVYNQLTSFSNLESFWKLFRTIFGTEYNHRAASILRFQWRKGDFSQFPQIKVIDSRDLQNANGAYSTKNNIIYLSEHFVRTASQQSLNAVILEEYGHFVDAQINQRDSPGDEGELFSALVRGVVLSSSKLTRMQTEDDHARISVGGESILVEESFNTTGYKQFGSSMSDLGNGITTDESGNIYVVGGTSGNLPGYSNLGVSDAFLTKYTASASGNPVWTKQFGSSSSDTANGISIDDDNNIYVTGFTYGDFSGNDNLGVWDAFITKYDASGNKVWAKQFGSSTNDYATAIYTDIAGNSYITGYTFGVVSGTKTAGVSDVFVAKYDANGNQIWIDQFGSSSSDNANGVTIDSSGNVYVVGYTASTLPGNTKLGINDAFITKYNASGDIVWIKQFGSSVSDIAYGVSTDTSGSIYVVGQTYGALAGNSSLGSTDGVLAKYDGNGTQNWIRQFGSSNSDNARAVTTDISGNIYVAGDTYGSLSGYTNLGSNDGFLIKYNASGTQLWAKQFGSSGSDNINSIRIDKTGNIYVAGYTSGSLPGNNSSGSNDAFVAGFDTEGNLLDLSNDLPLVSVSLNYGSLSENAPNNFVYTFSRSGLTTNALTVNFKVSGTAIFNTDYVQTGATSFTATQGTINFAQGSSTVTLTLNPIDDGIVESNETIGLQLIAGANYGINTGNVPTATIVNDDTIVSVSLSYGSLSEDVPDNYNFVYTFSRSGLTTNALTVNFKVSGTAIFNTDYVQTGATSFTATQGTINFAPGSSTVTLTLNPIDDGIDESDETINLQLIAGANYGINTGTVPTATIVNDDTPYPYPSPNQPSGGDLIDVLQGGAGVDLLTGGKGNDVLTGGAGSDTFRFINPNEGVDLINDFTPSEDLIGINAQNFGGGLVSQLTEEQLFIGSGNNYYASTRFIYNPVNGALIFDSDGNGSNAPIQFATLTSKPLSLSTGNFNIL
jgi:Ca2+-binding RTX toxin-like protein